mmetsp:Transcript_7865/g.22377  ORF Transcript_7865/g.22377 Transcript_7865/m.22377 type:complete len:210 (-) Transcript_7865:722-1351(-)
MPSATGETTASAVLSEAAAFALPKSFAASAALAQVPVTPSPNGDDCAAGASSTGAGRAAKEKCVETNASLPASSTTGVARSGTASSSSSSSSSAAISNALVSVSVALMRCADVPSSSAGMPTASAAPAGSTGLSSGSSDSMSSSMMVRSRPTSSSCCRSAAALRREKAGWVGDGGVCGRGEPSAWRTGEPAAPKEGLVCAPAAIYDGAQ